MDKVSINQMLYDHQNALIQAGKSHSEEDRAAFTLLADFHAGQISQWRTANGLSNAGWPSDVAQLD